jgi:hypothetical protein
MKYLYIGIVKCVIGSQNKIKRKQKYHTVGTIPKSNRKIVERDKIDTHDSHVHGWVHTSMNSGEFKLV